MNNKIIYIFIIFISSFCFINVKADSLSVNYNENVIFLDNENTDNEEMDCKSLGSFGEDLQSIFNVFKIVAPILTLALSTYDFVISITSKQAEGLQKSAKKFATRLVLVVLLYLLPTLINVLLGLTIGGNTCVE